MDTLTVPPEVETRLSDGTRVLIRLVRPDDKQLLQSGLQQLSPQSRYRRFFRQIDHFSERELRYLTEVDFVDHFAVVAVLPDCPGRPGIGVGRWIRLRDEPSAAEAAVTVIDAYQNLGLGTVLLHLLARSAVESSIKEFRVWTLYDNSPMRHLLEELGAIPVRRESAALELTVPLPQTPADLDETPAPFILRATATGSLTATAHGKAGTACRFEAQRSG